jgi:hypothetical protein
VEFLYFITMSTTAVIVKPSETTRESALNTDISGAGQPKRLHKIPIFPTKESEQKWQKEQMAAAFRIFAKMGFADGASGHISLRGGAQFPRVI